MTYTTLLAKVEAGMSDDERASGRLEDWPEVTRTKKGDVKVLATTKNVLHFLTRFQIFIRDDAFRWRYVLDGVPLREQLDDKAILDFKYAMECCGLTVRKDALWDALMAIAHLSTSHELRDTFDRLEAAWIAAGEPPVLDSWLADYAFVDDTAYSRAVSSKPLIAAVRRVRQPGYAFKYMPVLEGPQDIRKSSMLRELAMDTYFCDNLEFGASTKEIMEISSGVLIHEVPELSKMSGREVETVKAMMSRQKDKARLAYGRSTSEMPRQFILWGTSNDRKYLKDPTGSVRFWPVWSNATKSKPIDTEGLRSIVPLLWGEAAARERKGESCYLEGEAAKLAEIAQGDRYAGDANYDALSDALDGKDGFLPSHVLWYICNITDERAQQSPVVIKSINTAMTKLGWQTGKRSLYRYDGKTNKERRGWCKNCPKGLALMSWWDWNVSDRKLVAVIRQIPKAA